MRGTQGQNSEGIVVGGRPINNIRYADDTTLMATTEEKGRNQFEDLVRESEQFNMKINTKKTKVMCVSRRNRAPFDISLEGVPVEQVREFKFLGSYKTSTGDCTMEIKRRIGMAREKGVELEKIWKDKYISLSLKVKIMKTLVWSVFLYGAEGWTIKKAHRNRIEAFEMWCWRKLLGISWREHRTNVSVLEEMEMGRELMGRVAKLKLQYFGHVVRGSAGDLALTVLEGRIEGKRYQGAPKMKWTDNITEWTGATYTKCKRLAQDRTRWRQLIWHAASEVVNPRTRTTP